MYISDRVSGPITFGLIRPVVGVARELSALTGAPDWRMARATSERAAPSGTVTA